MPRTPAQAGLQVPKGAVICIQQGRTGRLDCISVVLVNLPDRLLLSAAVASRLTCWQHQTFAACALQATAVTTH